MVSSSKFYLTTVKLGYLKTVEFNIDHYSHSCKMYLENALQVEIEATKENKEPVKYQIPLTLKDNCSL